MTHSATASNGTAAVMVGEFDGTVNCIRYAPRTIGAWENRQEFRDLFTRAAIKLGWRPDRRCRTGWRKL